MANTYTQIHIQAVFAVRNRDCFILDNFKDELYKYIAGIIQRNNHKLLAINGMPNHIHILIGLRPIQSVSDLIQDIKGDSSKWINEKRLIHNKFAWQQGFAAFSYAKTDLPNLIKYIKHQEDHHKRKTFKDEYIDLLKEFDVEYDERFVFKGIDI